MNHVIYFIGGAWDQHKVVQEVAPRSTYEVAILPSWDSRPVPDIRRQAELKVKRETYLIDKIGQTYESTVYMARHEGLLK